MPFVREYDTVEQAVHAANTLQSKGIREDEVFVLAHDNIIAEQVAKHSDAKKIGMNEMGVATAIKNVFQNKSDKLRSKMEEIGLTSAEAGTYEKRLDDGKILLITKYESYRDYLM
ncbi:general stress protein [Peribacillus saganii]|uniref:General stress protein n=1 Tax=Peribacillus saganii TaxID=2303992 RepID=A0A372LAD3_9BACI|nr:general stress protein [Peribacillus saganii]RFU62597.1 general stress protein [Peribacillus saganii]